VEADLRRAEPSQHPIKKDGRLANITVADGNPMGDFS
jgi:hypothetical protein